MSARGPAPPLILLPATAVPPGPWASRYRRRPFGYPLGLCICLAIPVFEWTLLTEKPLWVSPAGWVGFAFVAITQTAILLAIGLACWAHVRAALRTTNWLARIDEEGVHVHIRSWLNWRFRDTGPTVVFIPWTSLRGVHEVRERLSVPRKNHVHLRYFAFAALTPVPGVDLGPLDRLARAELARVPTTAPFLRSFEAWDDVPIHVHSSGEIRIAWHGARMMRALSSRVRREPLQSVHTDSERILATGDDLTIRRHILDVLLHGERDSAIRLVQAHRGKGHDEAATEVEGLLKSGS